MTESWQRDAVPLIHLSPPIPCVSQGAGAGFVMALAKTRFWVRMPATTGEAPRQLTLRLPSGHSFTFDDLVSSHHTPTAQPPGDAETDWLAEVPMDQRETYQDLLGLVRKDQHISLCQTADVEASDRYTGFSEVFLQPKALPELAWEEISTRRRFLGHEFEAPLLIAGMTGGLERGAEINRRLARTAKRFGIPMGVGSQRIALENPRHAAIFEVKRDVPGVFLIGNLGASQLPADRPERMAREAIEMIGADALAIHVNVVQEVVQVEGDRDFRGLTERLLRVADEVSVPVFVKEVGGGLDPATAAELERGGLRALDVGGKGGTSWSYIEGLRAEDGGTRRVAESFRDWGIPTAHAVAALRGASATLEIVATGGIRDGLTVARALGLGATMAGVGLPLFKAALESEEAPGHVLAELLQGLKTAMICSGCRHVDDLPSRARKHPRFEENHQLYSP